MEWCTVVFEFKCIKNSTVIKKKFNQKCVFMQEKSSYSILSSLPLAHKTLGSMDFLEKNLERGNYIVSWMHALCPTQAVYKTV